MLVAVDYQIKEFIKETGKYHFKIIDAEDVTDKNGRPYLRLTFLDSKHRLHIEPVYPDNEYGAKKLARLAECIGGCYTVNNGATVIDTKELVGGFIVAELVGVTGNHQDMPERLFIRYIYPSTRRKDKYKSRQFARITRKNHTQKGEQK